MGDVILAGTLGSVAYGLAREGSDVDTLGVFVAPTLDVAGLDWHPSKATRVTTGPDTTFHEVGKYLSLALACNPTVMELLWLDEWTTTCPEGGRLVAARDAFLSTSGVANAYGGYARSQAARLAARGDTFSSNTSARTTKHARHLLRLLRQGRELLTTGHLTIRVSDPGDYWAFDAMTPDDTLAVYKAEDAAFADAYRGSVLPDRPDRDVVRDLLRDVRAAHVHDPSGLDEFHPATTHNPGEAAS